MNNFKKNILSYLCILVTTIITFYTYFTTTQTQIITHWNLNGQPDQYGPKFILLFFPLFLIVFYLLMTFLPLKTKNTRDVENNQMVLQLIKNILILFFTLLIISICLSSLQILSFQPSFILFIISFIFIFLGNIMPKIQPNRHLGFRIPWVFKSSNNWIKTHRFAGKIFVIVGFLGILASFIPTPINAIIFFVILFFAIITPTIYSYTLYKKENK